MKFKECEPKSQRGNWKSAKCSWNWIQDIHARERENCITLLEQTITTEKPGDKKRVQIISINIYVILCQDSF